MSYLNSEIYSSSIDCIGDDLYNAGWCDQSDNQLSFAAFSPLSNISCDSGVSGMMEQAGRSPIENDFNAFLNPIESSNNGLSFNANDPLQNALLNEGVPEFPQVFQEEFFIPPEAPEQHQQHNASYLALASNNQLNVNPYLEIIEEPSVRPFRYRYSSEMHGTHGCLMGVNSSKIRKTYPTVKLHNFEYATKAHIFCYLYQVPRSSTSVRSPHSHKLVIGQGKNEQIDPHTREVSSANDFTASFQGMGIIHTTKTNIGDALFKKICSEIQRDENRPLEQREIDSIRNDAKKQAKEMNLNQVCLCFKAYIHNEMKNSWHQVGAPVYSKVIKNMKSAGTGELRITRMSVCTSKVSGGQEVFMFVEKVCKNDIKIRFFEFDNSGHNNWEAEGIFSESDVHHQYGIVFKTPPYRLATIQKDVEVRVQLYRPSDGETSEEKLFYYKPNLQAGSKRPRTDHDFHLPTVLNDHNVSPGPSNQSGHIQNQNSCCFMGGRSNNDGNHQNNDGDESMYQNDNLMKCLRNLIESSDLGDIPGSWDEIHRFQDVEGGERLAFDGACSVEEPTDVTCSLLDKIKLLIKLFNNNFDEKKLQEMINVLIESQRKSGENILLDCIQYGTLEDIREFVLILVKYKLTQELNSINDLDQNCVHLLILNGYGKLLKIFLSLGVNVNQIDAFGNSPLHVAVSQNDLESVQELLRASTDIQFDVINDDGFTSIHLAVANENLMITKCLAEAGADLRKVIPQTGENVLHTAVKNSKINMPLINYLIERCQDLLQLENNSGLNVLQAAANSSQPESLIAHLETLYDESYTRREDCDYDDSTTDSESDTENEPSWPSLYDDQCIRELCKILDKDDKWKSMMLLLELEEKIDEWQVHVSPSKTLLKFIERNRKSLEDIYELFDLLDEREATAVIDAMVARKSRF